MSRYDDILSRLRAATGPDRENIDPLIATSVGGYTYEKRGRDQKSWFYPNKNHDYGRSALYGDADVLPRYTASIDAALSLVEEKLPGWFWWVGHLDQADRRMVATIAEKALPDFPAYRGIAPTAPLALLIALFTALEAQEEPHGL